MDDKSYMMDVANTITQQLGGRKLVFMTGANSFVTASRGAQVGLRFRFPQACSGKPNGVLILLNASDLYDVEFLYLRGTSSKALSTHSDVYAEDLIGLFEEQTGYILGF